jgi:LmbE family N-acetylglucosaminyl deacetylase
VTKKETLHMLAVMAHPDDAEVWAGGTLAKFVDRGHRAHIAVMTYGPHDPRGVEALAGAARLGATVDLLGLRDTAVRDTDEAADRLMAVLEREIPRIVIVHNPDDSHPDHEASFLVARRALIRWYAGPHRPPAIPSVYAAGTYRGMGLRGPVELDTFVDVSQQWDRKAHALLAHASQGPERWLPRQKVALQAMGARAGCELAEGFRRLVLFSEPGSLPHLDPALLCGEG